MKIVISQQELTAWANRMWRVRLSNEMAELLGIYETGVDVRDRARAQHSKEWAAGGRSRAMQLASDAALYEILGMGEAAQAAREESEVASRRAAAGKAGMDRRAYGLGPREEWRGEWTDGLPASLEEVQ